MAFTKEQEAQFKARYQAEQQARLQQLRSKPPATSGRGGFLTSAISEILGTGGAAGGAAVGTAILPGIGTLIGGGIGGLLGGFGGSAVEQKVRDDNVDFGKAATEGAISGVFGATPLRSLKLAKAAKAGAQAGTRGVTERVAQGALANAWGIKEGTKMAGSRALTPQRALKLQNFVIKDMGVPKTASASMVFERAVNFTDETGKALSSAIGANASKVSGKKVAANIEKEFANVLGGQYKNNPIAQDILTASKTLKDPTGVWSLKKRVADIENFARNPLSPDPAAEKFAQRARIILDKELNAIDGVAGLNKQYSNAQKVIDLVAPSAKTPRGLNIFNNRIGGVQAQRGQAAIGQAISNIPKATSTSRFATDLVKRGIIPDDITTQQPNLEQAVLSAQAPSQIQPTQTAQQSMSGEDVITLALVQAASAGATESDLSLLEMALPVLLKQKGYTFGSGGQDLSQSSKNALASSDNAINTVDQLQQLFTNAGSGSGRIGGIFKGLAADAGFDENAKIYTSLANASVTQIAKALAGSGSGTVSDMDAKVILDALPTIRDTPVEARAKFEALKQRLENAKQNTLLYGAGDMTTPEDYAYNTQGAQ